MLSIEDIYNEVGKNIFICPLHVENFRDSSIDLTISEFAWTMDGKNIYDDNKKVITIPANQTVCFLTEEAIFVGAKIGGTYHSRVSMVRRGLGHIGTMLDPKYCGRSLIVMQNMINSDIEVKVGERIISIAFYYLKTPIGAPVLTCSPGHQDKIVDLDKEKRYDSWIEKNQWAGNAELLKRHFKEYYQKDFKEKRKAYAQKKNIFERVENTPMGERNNKICNINSSSFSGWFFHQTVH